MDSAASNPQRKNLIVAEPEIDGILKPRVEFIWEGHDKTGIPEVRRAADGIDPYGLTALSLLTGKPLDLCVRFVREAFPEFKTAGIPGLSEDMILAVVPRLGCSATSRNIFLYRNRRPTLGAMLGVMRPRHGRAYLIVEHERRHCIVRKGWKLYDSYCPGGEFVRRYPFRKLMVGTVWEVVENATEQLCLPFVEYWLRRDYY